MKLLQLSLFRIMLSKLILFRFLTALVLMLLVLEGISRLAPYIVGKQVHQSFLYSEFECKYNCMNKGKMLTWMSNERGARGGFYHGQPIQIAVIGSSTSIGTWLDQKESWPEQLKMILGSDMVHVDNYARDAAGQREAKVILKALAKTNKRYDIILIMQHIAKNGEESQRSAFYYWGQWFPKGKLLQFPELLFRRLRKQAKSESRLNRTVLSLKKTFARTEQVTPAEKLTPSAVRSLRLEGKIKFVDEQVSISGEKINWIKSETRQMLKWAKKAADRVYLISHPIAYDEKEHPGVSLKWRRLPLIKGLDNCCRSNKSMAERTRKNNLYMAEVASVEGVDVIDLDGHMRSMLRDRDDLFDDKWHFTPVGAAVAAQFISKTLEQSM